MRAKVKRESDQTVAVQADGGSVERRNQFGKIVHKV